MSVYADRGRIVGVGWLLLVLLTGCATPGTDDPLRNTTVVGPDLATVRAAPQQAVGARVRWGGTIARVENRRDTTWVEVVGQPLRTSGRPEDTPTSAGRFVAQVTGFLDPVLYAEGRPFTVTGTVQPPVERIIGEHPYTFPVVAVEHYRLWDKEPEREVYFYPYFYGGSDHFGIYSGFPYRYRRPWW